MMEMRRVLALVLCLVMLVGIMPVGAFATEGEMPAEETAYTDLGTKSAAEETEEQTQQPEEIQHLVSVPEAAATVEAAADVDYLFIATDRHADTEIIGTLIDAMETEIEDTLDYLALGGDMVGSGGNHPAYNSSTVLEEVTGATSSLSAANVDIVAGIHDMNVTDDAGIVLPYQGGGAPIYTEDDDYYVYGVEEYCVSKNSNETVWSEQSAAFVEWAEDLPDDGKAIVVVSHYPLHKYRNDNYGAYYWHKALNKVATGSETGGEVIRNVFFFHGHNHTEDLTNYLYNVGETMTIQNGSSGSVSEKVYYTYATAGYLSEERGNGEATLMTITDDQIALTRYSSSKATVAMTTVDRVVVEEEVTLTGIAVTTAPTTTEYTVGDTFSTEGMVVTATYSDGTTAPITDYTVSEVDMTTAGPKTVTVTYQDKTATFYITVSEAATEPSEPAGPTTITFWDDYETVTIQATATGLTDGAAENLSGEIETLDAVYTDYVALDIALTGAAEGAEVAYSILVVENMDTTNMTVYHVDGDTLTPVACEVVTDAQGNQYVVFTSDLTGIFAYGSPVVPEGYAIDSISIEGIPYDVFVGTSVDLTDSTITATYTKDGAEDFIRVLTVYDYDLDNFSEFDVNTLGKQTIIFTFDGAEKTFDINVWGEEFTVDGVTVHVGEGEYGVSSVTVKESENEHVASAVAAFVGESEYVAYDISMNFDENYQANGEAKTVTLPVPENITKPVVYYVSDDGVTVTDMGAVVSEDGKTVTFTTDHFSTYVLADGTSIETESGNATVEGSSTTTTEEKTVYVKVDAPVAGENYLIVSTGAAGTAGYILGGSSVTPISDTLTVDGTEGTYTYIESTGTLWTASGSGSNWTFANGSNYLGYTRSPSGNEYVGGLTYSYAVNTAASSTAWTLSNNQMYIYLQSSTAGSIYGGSNSSENYYLTGGTNWSMSDTAANVYFYKEVTATITTTTGTVGHVYSTEGTDITDAVAISGQTVTLSSVLYDTPDGGTKTDITASSKLTPTYEVVTTKGNPAVISGIENGVATLSGTVGTAVVKVTYTSGDLVAWDEFIVTANAPVYDLSITKSTSQLRIGGVEVFAATPTINGTPISDFTGLTIDGTITWKSENSTIAAAVTNTNTNECTVTGVAVGNANITATWTDPNGDAHTATANVEVVDALYALDLVAPVYTEATVTEDTFANGTYYKKTTIYEKVTITEETFGNATYYTLNEDGITYSQAEAFDASATYYKAAETYKHTTTYEANTTYYTQSTYVEKEVASATEFNAGIFYIINDDGAFQRAATYDADATYYVPNSITKPIIIKDVASGQGYTDVWAAIYADGTDLGKLTDKQLEKLTYISSNTSIATVDKTTGHIKFQGGTGTVIITCMYEYAEGKFVTDTVLFSVSDEHYYVPEDGTDDFPEYPNEGAIRFDKTATAVGNFSKTGITKVELSMTGVPYTTGNELDVVVMLDQSTSMDDNRISATVAATKAFIQSIVISEDGSFNTNRVYVGYFNGSKTYDITDSANIGGDLATIDSQTELDDLFADIDDEFDGSPSTSGTEYGVALEKCHTRLKTARTDGTGNERQQFCVFMSDGVPTTLQVGENSMLGTSGNTNDGYSDMKGMFTGTNYNTRSSSYQYEYYSTQMKSEGVTVYTVGLGLEAKNNAWSSASATQCLNAASLLLNDISGPAKETTVDTGSALSKKDSYFFSVEDADAATEMANVFKNIAQKILDAAKDVKVVDKMADEFTMVFEAPNATVAGQLPSGQEFYIEVLDYTLNPVYNTAGEITDYVRNTTNVKSLMKVYLGTASDGSYYAATAANSTAGTNKFAAPTFNTDALGTKFYWTTDASKASTYKTVENGAEVTKYDAVVTVTEKINNTDTEVTYYFVSDGNGTHNMASGAYASGTKDASGTSQDLIIATPYFVYNAKTKMLVWTADKLTSSELALTYFLYLDNSAGYTGTNSEIEAGTYETNEYANLYYKNFQDTECEQEFPVPKITWNGAQVSYVFYLVNKNGQPVNRAGRVVPFSEAVYVTDVFTYAIVWNDLEQTAALEASYLAKDLVPDVYKLYDESATYNIHVFEDEKAQNLNNHFIIGGGTKTTYVFNTKSDTTKYTVPATYAAAETYLCKDYNVTVNADNSVTYNGNADDQFKENGQPVYGTDDEGAYTIVTKTGATKVETGFDFSNTTVAFAVTWVPELVPDTVVVDFGLDVVIDVTTNDALASGVVGVCASAPAGVEINTGSYSAAKASNAEVKLGDATVGTAYVESLTAVRFSLNKENSMLFNAPATFYYESDVNFYNENNTLTSTSMYSSVTVIPATTIYYEDDFIVLTSYTKDGDTYKLDDPTKWTQEGTTISATQDQDRPGESLISDQLDADNPYGYDSAYEECSTFSLGSARKITVNPNLRGEASFSFYGTGFDVISMTSNKSGTLILQVTDENGKQVKSGIIDTYYGYKYENGKWEITDENDPNALYQVPVVKYYDMPYGKYTVKLIAGYNEYFDHNDDSEYTLWLDAIRIYDPCGVDEVVDDNGTEGTDDDTTIGDVYGEDGELMPDYFELRNMIIKGEEISGFLTEADVGFAEGVTYYTDNKDGTYTEVKTGDAYSANATYVTAAYEAADVSGGFAENGTYYVKLADGTYAAVVVDGKPNSTLFYYTQYINTSVNDVGITEFAEGKNYYHKNADGTYTMVVNDRKPVENVDYYTVKLLGTEEFDASVTYYLRNADGTMTAVVRNGMPIANVFYAKYCQVPVYDFQVEKTFFMRNAENGTYYAAVENGELVSGIFFEEKYVKVEIEEFAENVTYYTKNWDDTYTVAGAYRQGTEYYVRDGYVLTEDESFNFNKKYYIAGDGDSYTLAVSKGQAQVSIFYVEEYTRNTTGVFAEKEVYYILNEADQYVEVVKDGKPTADVFYFYEKADIQEFAADTEYLIADGDGYVSIVVNGMPADVDYYENAVGSAYYDQDEIKAFASKVSYFIQDTDGKYIAVVEDCAPVEGTEYFTLARDYVETEVKGFAADKTYYCRTGNSVTVAETTVPVAGTVYYVGNADAVASGIVFIDGATNKGAGNTAFLTDYINYGPNNEVYLAPGQAISAAMNAEVKDGYTANVHLGVKTVTGSASVEVYGLNANGIKTYAIENMTISTATDLYYDITALDGQTIVIRNSGSEGIVSVTNAKVAYEPAVNAQDALNAVTVNAAAEEEQSLFTVSSETLKLALLSLRAPVEEEAPVDPDGNEPGGDAPEGNEPGGDAPEGNEPGGDAPEGNEPGGDAPEGNESGGDAPEGNEPGGENGEIVPDESQPEESKPEESVPEETKPEAGESIEETVRDIIDIVRDIIGIIGGIFGGWF